MQSEIRTVFLMTLFIYLSLSTSGITSYHELYLRYSTNSGESRGVGSNLVVGAHGERGRRAYNGGLRVESFLTFGRPTKAAEFAVLTISCEVRICDVSTKLNRLPCNPPPENWGDISNWMGSLVLESGEG